MIDKHPLLKFLGFAAVCLAFAVWLVLTIGNIELFEDRIGYEAEFADAMGLLANDAVKVAGVDVGKVTGVRTERGRAVVSFSVSEDVRLGLDTSASVRWRSVLGQRFMYVNPTGTGQLEAGSRIAIDRTTTPADFGMLLERLTPVMRALDPDVGNQVVRAFAEALVGREDEVQQLIADAASLTDTLADRDVQIGRLLDNAATVVEAYSSREEQLHALMESFADVSTTLAARNDELLDAVVRVSDVQRELRSLLERNDGEIRAAVDELDGLTAILSVYHPEIEEIATHMGRGIVAYQKFSRWGQWFNVRVVGFSSGGEVIATERDAEHPPPVYRGEDEGPIAGAPPAGDGSATVPRPAAEAPLVSGASSLFTNALTERSDATVGGDG